jgi:S-adenosylmethionine hydrolase
MSGQTWRMPFAETFASVPSGRMVLHEDSFRLLTVAVNQGDAAGRIGARTGDPVVVSRVVD